MIKNVLGKYLSNYTNTELLELSEKSDLTFGELLAIINQPTYNFNLSVLAKLTLHLNCNVGDILVSDDGSVRDKLELDRMSDYNEVLKEVVKDKDRCDRLMRGK